MKNKDIAPKAAVVIVNWNGIEYLPDCLSTVFNQTCENYDVILVDNGSKDGSVELAQENFPRLKAIKNKDNLGFAAGNNIGIKEALGNGADYVALLNYDTSVEKDWLEELVKTAESDQKIGICQSKILLFDKQDVLNTAGNEIQFLGFGYCGHYMEEDKPEFDEQRDIPYGSGASILVKRELFEKVGMFDEDLFMYHEDLDLGWEARLRGFRVVFAPKSKMYHKYSFEKSKQKYYLMERNRFIILLKNYRLKTLFLILPALLFMESGLWFYSLLGGWFFLKIRGYGYLIGNFGRIMQKRKVTQRQRTVNDSEIVKLFASRIQFSDISNPILDRLVNPCLSLYWRMIRPLI